MTYRNGAGRRTFITAVAAAILIICGSPLQGETAEAAPASVAPPSPLDAPVLDELRNATYTGIGTVPVKLTGGIYEGPPYLPGGASRQRIELLDSTPVYGDLNGDGTSEAVVFLAEDTGGTMTLYHMAVMSRVKGSVVTAAAVPLGDRVSIRSILVDRGQITLELLQHGARDAACCPSDLVTRVWSMERSGLVERPGKKWGGTLKLATLEGVEWRFRGFSPQPAPEGGAGTTLVFEKERISGTVGCNRYLGSSAATKIPGELSLKASKSTNRECGAAVLADEDQYLGALRRTVRYGFFLGDLVLTWQKKDGSLGTMRFAPRKAPPK